MHFLLIFSVLIQLIFCDPLINTWDRTKARGTAFKGITGGIQIIRQTSTDVYIYTSGLPQYPIGPWNNPNEPADLQFWFQFPKSHSVPGIKTAVPLGHVGVFRSGVSVFNGDDGRSYRNLGVWKQNAYYWEGVVTQSFDACNGHANNRNEYHYHIDPSCDYQLNPNVHSPIVGYAFDGFPIYGPYSYERGTDTFSRITRMRSSYQLRKITQRQILANGTRLQSSQFGPDVSTQYPLGAYIDDFEFVTGSGDLDRYNGRFTVTPEYPNGIYCYFITINEDGSPAYPFILGTHYYGAPTRSNIGPNSGKTAPPASAVTVFQFN